MGSRVNDAVLWIWVIDVNGQLYGEASCVDDLDENRRRLQLL